MSVYTWFATGLALVIGCASHPAAKSDLHADAAAHGIDSGVTLPGDHDSAVHDAAANPALSDAAVAPQLADGAARPVTDASLDASRPDANWMSPVGSGWNELRGDTVGHGDRFWLRKELEATLSGVPGYKVGRAFVLKRVMGSIQTTLLVELTNVSAARHCGIRATPVWKTSGGQVLVSDESIISLRGSIAQVLNADGSANRFSSDCLAPAELGYLTVDEVAHTGDVPLYESAASIGLTLSEYTTGAAPPDFLLVPKTYTVRPVADADADTVTVTLTNEGSASAPVDVGTAVLYILLDVDGLPVQVGHMVPRARTPLAAHGSMEASSDILLFGASQHMLIDVCLNGCPY